MSVTPTDAERVARLASELAELGRRLAWARHELLTLPLAGAPPIPSPGEDPMPWQPATPESPPASRSAARPSAPRPPAARPAARSATDGLLGGRVLAWVGGSMTLVGVVLFLVLAASRGWFGVPARLIAGAVLGVALVWTGRRLHRTQHDPGAEVGALALVGTGIAALYLDVGAATAKYHYLPDVLGMVCGLAVAGVGLALADRWRSAQLGAAVLFGAGLFMPAVTGGSLPVLVGLVLVAQAAAVPVVARRGWRATAVIGAAFPLVYGSATAWHTLVPELFNATGEDYPARFALVAVFLVGTLGAVVMARRLSAGLAAGLLVAAPVPALQLAGIQGGASGVWLAALIGVALLAVGLWRPALAPARVRAAAAAAGAVAIFQATVLWLDGSALTGTLLGQALTLTAVSWLTGRRMPLFGALAYAVAGLWLALVRDAPLRALTDFPAEPYLVLGRPDHPALVTGLGLSLLVVLLAGGFVLAAARVGLISTAVGTAGAGRMDFGTGSEARPEALPEARPEARPEVRSDARSAWVWAPAGAVALYGATGVVVTTGLLIASVPAGFVTAHAVVTVSWTLAALLLLARGISRRVPRVAGLVLVAAALTKLLLFDLVALDGLARVGAFLGAGLVLLAAGARYARLVAAQQTDQLDGLAGQRADHRQSGQPDQPRDHRDGVLDQGPGPGQPG